MQISCSFPLHNITFELPRAETFPFTVMFVGSFRVHERLNCIAKSKNNPIFCRKMTDSAQWRSQLISEIPQGPTLRRSLRSLRGKILTDDFPNAQPFFLFSRFALRSSQRKVLSPSPGSTARPSSASRTRQKDRSASANRCEHKLTSINHLIAT